jgi:alanyl-tRNA synthetase
VERIVLVSAERIQDGIVRLTVKAGGAAKEYMKKGVLDALEALEAARGCSSIEVSAHLSKSLKDEKSSLKQLHESAIVFSVQPGQVAAVLEKFCRETAELEADMAKAGRPATTKKIRPVTLQELCSHVFETWKGVKKEADRMRSEMAGSSSVQIAAKAKDGRVFEVLETDRKGLIETATSVITSNPALTIILANRAGDIVVMSRKEDASKIMKEIASKAGGAGGGKPEFAQGRADFIKLMEAMK